MLTFKKHNDPLTSLNIGKRALITGWLDKMNVENYKINKDFSISVNGYVDLAYKNLNKFPDYIQFDIISGNFTCSNNGLITLKGGPKLVLGSFVCRDNQLSSLEHAPYYVTGEFYSYNNACKFMYIDILKYCRVDKPIYP
jgi:hypothetical protein